MLASTSRPLVAAARATGRRNASAIATKYSGAAYKAALASSSATLTKVSEELSAIAKSLKDTPALNAFVSNPLLSSKERATGLESLYKAGSTKGTVNDITKNLLAVLSENGRLAETPAVIEEFNALVAKYKGELEIVVTSAQRPQSLYPPSKQRGAYGSREIPTWDVAEHSGRGRRDP